MKTEKSDPKIIPFAIVAIVLLALAICVPVFMQPRLTSWHSLVVIYFFEIDLALVLTGTFLFAFYKFKRWISDKDFENDQITKETENKHKAEQQAWLMEDAKNRRTFQRERDPITDMFQMAEMAKIKTEETNVYKETEKPNTVSTTNKTEKINNEEFNKLIDKYASIISKNKTE